MQTGKFNVVTDGNWGSCGKGMVSSALVARCRPDVLSTTNMPNAGHTAVNEDGASFTAKALPAAAIMARWLSGYAPKVLVGPSAAFEVGRLLMESGMCGAEVRVHGRAGIVTEAHKTAESGEGPQSTKHVASTMQGCGAFLAEKVLRKAGILLARECKEINEFLKPVAPPFWRGGIKRATALHEGSQGFSLDINWGSHYPNCTSRGTTAVQNAADMGVAPRDIGDVYLVIRPYPIRVGNVYEEGKQVGYSGDCYGDQEETSWEAVAFSAGMPSEEAEKLVKKELTTVTKRLRRVFTFSRRQLREAAAINGATGICLNFANYIDYSCRGCREWSRLPPDVMRFAEGCEDLTGVPVVMIGTGSRYLDVCWRPHTPPGNSIQVVDDEVS